MAINVLDYFEDFLKRADLSKVAVIDGPRQFTFGETALLAKRFAANLLARKDVINQPVAVFLGKSAEVVFADLGILYSGNFYSNLDVKSPAQRVKNILENIRPKLVITSRAHETMLKELGIPGQDIILVEEMLSFPVDVDGATLLNRVQQVLDSDPICIINTSGSTGTPKGVVLSHRGTIDFMDWAFTTLGLDGTERIGSLSPFYFDIYTLELWTCLAKGATIVLVPEQLSLFPAKLLPFLQEQAINFVFWVPSIMVNISSQDLLEKFPLPSITKVLFAGEVFPTKHLNRWRKALPGATFVNLYGPVEIHVDCTYFILDRPFADDESIPIGFPCRNTDVLVLNESGQRCQTGEQGELCVRGSSLASGYWNDPERTAKVFVQNPLNPHFPELIYRTGDLVYRNARGELMFVGRKDFQIKHMGYRIDLGEVEHQVLSMPGIANACVLYHAEAKEITLFYESGPTAVAPADIRKHLLKIFPKYMLPTVFHLMAELPRNPNGKIDRNLLKSRLLQAIQ